MIRTVLLIRHGAVDMPAVGTGIPRVYGPHEPLSDRGFAQGQQLAENLTRQGYTPDYIFTSQFERAHQTAQILRDTFPTHPPILIDHEFNGAGTPQWNNRPLTELGTVGNNLFADNPLTPEIHGESLPHAYNRVITEYKRVLESHKTGTIAIVTHGEVIGMIVHHLQNGEFCHPGIDRSIDKGEALVLRYGTEGKLIDEHVVYSEGTKHSKERR